MTKRHDITPASLAAKLRAEAKGHHTDGGGLFLITTAGSRTGSWKFQYVSPLSGKRTKRTLGTCFLATDGTTVMGTTLKEARDAHQKAVAQLAQGLDPNVEAQRLEEAAAAQHAANVAQAKDNLARRRANQPPKDSFADCCERWIESQRGRMAASTLREYELCAEKYINPIFGDTHIAQVSTADVAAMHDWVLEGKKDGKVVQPRERAYYHALIKARRVARLTCDWAIHPKRNLRSAANPVFEEEELWDAIPNAQHHPALVDAEGIRELMLAITAPVPAQSEWDLHGGRFATPTVTRALRFLAMTGQRSHNVQQARKEHFFLDASMPHWVIPAVEMKGRTVKKKKADAKPHVVFLAPQAVALLREQFAAFADSEWVFPGQFKGKGNCMGSTALGDRLNVLGFQGRQSPHGFRATMRTAGEAFAGCNPVMLEEMLAHKKAKDALALNETMSAILNGGMAGTYDRKGQLEARNIAMRCQEAARKWCDWLDLVASDAWREQNNIVEFPPLKLAA